MNENLLNKKCVPCEGGILPLTPEIIEIYMKETPGWELEENKKIKKQFEFKDFKEAISFVNKIADLAEEEGHHPDFHIFYNKLILELRTHAIGGLSENDFILAAKISALKN